MNSCCPIHPEPDLPSVGFCSHRSGSQSPVAVASAPRNSCKSLFLLALAAFGAEHTSAGPLTNALSLLEPSAHSPDRSSKTRSDHSTSLLPVPPSRLAKGWTPWPSLHPAFMILILSTRSTHSGLVHGAPVPVFPSLSVIPAWRFLLVGILAWRSMPLTFTPV